MNAPPESQKTKPAAKPPTPQTLAKRGVAEEFQSPVLLAEVAKVLPKHLTAERLMRVAQTMVLFKPELLACTIDSLRRCVLICAQAGLEPDGRLAHIIAYGTEAKVIFDWKGLVALASRNNVQVTPKLVFAADKFEVLEDDGDGHTKVHHSADYTKARGEIVAVYSRAKMQDGAVDYEIMPADEVENIRQQFSRAKNADAWVKSWGEMAKKTVIRRHSKRWDLMPEIRDVINADDDTPAPFNPTPKFSRPLFGAPAALQDAEPTPPGNGGTAEPPAGTSTGKLLEEATQFSELRKRCKADKIKETELLGFLIEIGSAEPGTESLETLALENEAVLRMVTDQWADVSQRILAARNVPE